MSELEREVAHLKSELGKARRAGAAKAEVPQETAEPIGDAEQEVDMEAHAVSMEAALMEAAYAGGGRDTIPDGVMPTGEAETGGFGERGATASDEGRGAAPDEQVDKPNSPTTETDGLVR